MIRQDTRAIEGLPLRLLTVSLLLSLTVPLAMDSLQGLEREAERRLLEENANRLRVAGSEVFIAGPGNVRTIVLRWDQDRGGGYLVISHDPESARSRKIEVFQGALQVDELLVVDPDYPLIGREGDLQIGQSARAVRLSCELVGQGPCVVVEVIA